MIALPIYLTLVTMAVALHARMVRERKEYRQLAQEAPIIVLVVLCPPAICWFALYYHIAHPPKAPTQPKGAAWWGDGYRGSAMHADHDAWRAKHGHPPIDRSDSA